MGNTFCIILKNFTNSLRLCLDQEFGEKREKKKKKIKISKLLKVILLLLRIYNFYFILTCHDIFYHQLEHT